MDIQREAVNDLIFIELTVSVFDVRLAVDMMIDSKMFFSIRHVHITPEFKSGRYSLKDAMNNIIFEGGCDD